MLDPKTSRFWKAAVQSGLLDTQQLTACWESIPAEKRDEVEHIDRRLGRQAVHLELLTLWQAQQLLAGRVAGFKVDRYLLLELIGQGGMGRVYRATDTRLGREVALKILSPDRMNNPRAIARFQREARVGAQLQHENLVRLYDFGESQGRHFLVMEFIEGKTLGFYIATQARLPHSVAANFARQVALGLDHAHAKGLIHRDVNPYNVIVTSEGIAKLADMGLAIDRADEARVTRDGATVGTFDYVAPEQARHSHSADIRSDIYSLGCSLYHMLAGQVPFPHPSLAEKLFAHQSQEAPTLESTGIDIPTGLADVVRRMMRKLPEERYQQPQEVIAALGLYAGKLKPPSQAFGGMSPGGLTETSGLSTSAPLPSTTDSNGRTPESSAEFAIKLDLGPTPLLATPTKPAKPWFKGSNPRPTTGSGSNPVGSGSSGSADAGPIQGVKRWALGGVAGLFVAAMIVGFPYLRGGGRAQPGTHSEGPAAPTTSKAGGDDKPALNWGTSVVGVMDDKGVLKPAADLFHAMEAAVGGRGVVILRGGPHDVKAAEGHSLNGRGTLRIEGENDTTVLRVEMDGARPFLSTGSTVDLVLKNLTFEARRTAATENAAPPIVLAGGKAMIDHCSFRTSPPQGFAGSCAVASAGGPLVVANSWFEGFESAIDVASLSGVEHSVRQSMFVPGGTPSAATTAGLSPRRGWAGRIRFEGGGAANRGRNIKVDHCTFVGEGMFDLYGFGESAPIKIDVSSSAFRTERLLKWAGPSGSVWSPKALLWAGTGNQLDVAGEPWIAAEGTSSAVSGLDDWVKVASEKGPIREGIQFTMAPETPDGRLTPPAYAMLRPPTPTPGADPQEVGPEH